MARTLHRTTIPVRETKPATTLLDPRAAYDLFAERYDTWRWQEFWRRNEWPLAQSLAESARAGASILDVGSGTGFYLQALQAPGRMLFGLDISQGMLNVARRKAVDAAFVEADARQIPFPSHAFDIVLLTRVASHLPDLDALASELSRLLKPQGRLILSDLAPEHAYSCTEFEAPESRILVETYKHSIDDWTRATRHNGLGMMFKHVITSANAEWLPGQGFTSIDRRRDTPIAFVLGFEPRRPSRT